jgi:hypothetical protein
MQLVPAGSIRIVAEAPSPRPLYSSYGWFDNESMPFRAASLYAVVLCAVLFTACVGREKSENVLSPTVAGPIPGVTIGMPVPLEPKDGRNIDFASQPITLLLENAPSNGERPLNYLFELATDSNFGNIFFVRENIVPGEGGRTALRLSDALPTGRTYFWRARAQDGANTGVYSGPAHFNVYTPILIERPTPFSPANNVAVDTVIPRFTIGNAARSGPVGSFSYILELADSDSFESKEHIWTFGEQPGQTLFTAPSPLFGGRQYFWRVRAYDTNDNAGDWSPTAVFRTVAQGPPPTQPGTGGSCTSQGTPLAILQCRRNQFGPHMSDSQLVAFLKSSASDINRLGSEGAPWGVLEKSSGANCDGFACDILCLGNGSGQVQRDVLLDAEGAQTPVWGNPVAFPTVRPCLAP